MMHQLHNFSLILLGVVIGVILMILAAYLGQAKSNAECLHCSEGECYEHNAFSELAQGGEDRKDG